MTALPFIVTRAGLRAFTDAQTGTGGTLTIVGVGLTNAPFASAPTLEALPGEFRRLSTIAGDRVGDNIVHMTLRDEEPIGYTARGLGLYLADGTLFGVYGQAAPLFEKSQLATLMAAIDIAFPTGAFGNIAFGATDFLNPPATTERAGVVELATEAEALVGLDTRRVASVSILARLLAAIEGRFANALQVASAAIANAIGLRIDDLAGKQIAGGGLVTGGGRNDTDRELVVLPATVEQLKSGAADVAVTPASLAAMVDLAAGSYAPLPGIEHRIRYVAGPFNEGAVNIVFEPPFPNACLIIIPVPINNSGSALRDIYLQEQSLSASGAVVFVQKAGSDGTSIDGIRYLAIGH